MFALPSGLQLGWLIYERARALTGAASHIGSWISLLLTDVDGEVRQLLEQLVHRVDALTPALHFALAWSSDKGSAVSDVVFQAKAELFRVEQFIALCGRQQGQVKLLDREWLIRHLHLHLRELEFSISAVNLAVSLVNASRPTQPSAAVLSTSALLRASDRLHSMTDTAGDVTCSYGALYTLSTPTHTHTHQQQPHTTHSAHSAHHTHAQHHSRAQHRRAKQAMSDSGDGRPGGGDEQALDELEEQGKEGESGGVGGGGAGAAAADGGGVADDDADADAEMMRGEEPVRAAGLYLGRSRLPLDASTFLTDVDHFSADPEGKRRKRREQEEEQKDRRDTREEKHSRERTAAAGEGGGGAGRGAAGALQPHLDLPLHLPSPATGPAAATEGGATVLSTSSPFPLPSPTHPPAPPVLSSPSSPPLASHLPPVCDVRLSLNSGFTEGTADDHVDGQQQQPHRHPQHHQHTTPTTSTNSPSARTLTQSSPRQQQRPVEGRPTEPQSPLSSASPSAGTRPSWERMSATFTPAVCHARLCSDG